MKQIAILSNDERYMRMIPKLLHGHWQIHLLHEVEEEGNIHIHHQIHQLPFEQLQMIILPIKGLDLECRLPIDEQIFYLSEDCLLRIPTSCILYTGVHTPALIDIKNRYQLTVIPFFTYDDVAIYNAIPTAEGALQLAMEHTKRTIHDTKVLVFGYGRVGQTVCRLFAAVGANVTVISNDASELAWAAVYRLQTRRLNDAPLLSDFPIIINTIPAPIISNQMLKQMRDDVLVIDLASMPGGIEKNASYTDKRQIIHALALPTKVAPVTASEIIFHAIMRRQVE